MDVEQELRRRLRAQPDVLFAFLFGSRTGAGARPDSDWDVAIYASPMMTDGQRFDLRRALEADLGDLGQTDITMLNDAPPLLAQRALQGERVVIRDKAAYVRFFVRAAALAGDERFWAGLHMSQRARRLAENKFGRP